jgi:serine/threonine-protein kinase
VGVVLYELLTGTVPFTGSTPLEIAMKHLSQIPEPPSRLRPDVPPDLDRVVVRALAKNPDERYQSAQEMEADLARVERGLPVSDETAEAATAVLAGSGIEAATAIRTAPTGTSTGAMRSPYGPSTYYDYVPPVRRRPIWPWLLALLLLVAAGIGGWYAYAKIQNELAQAKPVSVPNVQGEVVVLAKENIVNAGLKPHVRYQSNADYPRGKVYQQNPAPGEKIDRGNTVTLWVSTGKPRVYVDDVVGKTEDQAKTALQSQGLRVNAVQVYSKETVGTVLAQDPSAGQRVIQGTVVRINVSQGPRPVAVPNVVGQSYDAAAGSLTAAGFQVRRVDVQANSPAGTVVAQDPGAGTSEPPGSSVIVSVSKGPSTTAVPDVEGLDTATAKAQLQNAGFKVAVQTQNTQDPAEDGIVITQDPRGGSQAQLKSTVLITVGKLVAPTTTDTTAVP